MPLPVYRLKVQSMFADSDSYYCCRRERKSKTADEKCFPGTEIILCGYTGLEGTLRLVEEAEADLRTRFTPSFIEKQSVARNHLYFRNRF